MLMASSKGKATGTVNHAISPSPKSCSSSAPPDSLDPNSQMPRKLLRKSKSGHYFCAAAPATSPRKVEESVDSVKRVVDRSRSGNPSVALARRRRQRLPEQPNMRHDGDVSGKNNNKELVQKLERNESLIQNLRRKVLELKTELDEVKNFNLELQSQNRKLSDDFATAEAKIAALTSGNLNESISESQNVKFKEIQRLITNKLEHSKLRKEAFNEPSTTKAPSAVVVSVSAPTVARKSSENPSHPPPPPPPLPPRRGARGTASGKVSVVEELYHSLIKQDRNKDPPFRGNHNKPAVNSAHNSIVGEIQNRSAHLLAIKSDIETKGEFINDLIQKVLDAAYSDIEDVQKFVDWLDNELSSLVDERAVLKHFKWPEKKADAMREAAIEYRSLKLLESEMDSYDDDSNIPCEVALKKMAHILDKSERKMQRLIKLRNSVILSYQDLKIPYDWMHDSGIVSKIKQASIRLAKLYVKRVTLELESIRSSERESTQGALLLQGVHFAYRAHQFAGGLDPEILCTFEEMRRRVSGNLRGSQELLLGIPSS